MLVASLGGCGARTPLGSDDEPELPDEDGAPRAIVAIAAGGPNTCVLRRAGAVTCFGGGVGEPQDLAFSPAVELAVGALHACVITEAGSVECVDLSDYDEPRPIAPPTLVPGIDDATRLTAGPDHACAVHGGGQLVCWGDNALGQLGIGSFEPAELPTPVGLGPVLAVAAGEFNTCALVDGGAYCWGRGALGALGDGVIYTDQPETPIEANSVPSPVRVVGLSEPTQLSAGLNAACVLEGARGDVMCWGDNAQPTPGGIAREPVSVAGLEPAAQVFVGYTRLCAVGVDGGVHCWGTGPLGDGALQSDGVVDVSDLTEVQAVVGGWSHTCALVEGGEVYCWGGGDGFSHVGGSDGGPWLTPTRLEL